MNKKFHRIFLVVAIATMFIILVQLFSVYLNPQDPQPTTSLTSPSQLGHQSDNDSRTKTDTEPLNPNEKKTVENEGGEMRVKENSRKPGDQDKVKTKVKAKVKVSNGKFLVDTPTCTIPRTKIMTNYYKKLYFYNNTSIRRRQNIPDCSDEVKLSTLIKNDRLLEMNSKYYPYMNCSLLEAVRVEHADNNFSVIDHGPIREPLIDVTSMELLMTVCDNVIGNRTITNYDARLPLKPAVLKKMKFWEKEFKKMKKNKPKKNTKDETKNNPDSDPFPVNVLIIGFDSIARSHFHRSVPKTIRRLTEDLNFVDFQGFHSIYAHTVYVLGPLLHGDGDCTAGCDKEDSTECEEARHDRCPMLWKEFNRRNYVTMFSEDKSQSFNYAGMEGFKARPPTDYYPHPLFVAHVAHREPMEELTKQDCMSTEGVPQFHLRYLSRFLKMFKDTPFFSFLFHAHPFHDHVHALADYDDDLDNFIRIHFQENPELLEKTLIVIMADHGERYGHYYTYSLESYLERVLPLLYIRVPEVLKRKYPDIDFQGNLEKNSRKLTTALDLHHTLLHTLILSLTSSGKKEELLEREDSESDLPGSQVQLREFNESLIDRASLLTQVVPSNRTCASLGIDSGTCVCNSSRVEEIESVNNPYLLHSLSVYVIEELNAAIANSSRFGDKCREWDRQKDGERSATLIKQTPSYREVLFHFFTDAIDGWEKSSLKEAEGEFQVKIRIHKVNREKSSRKGQEDEKEDEVNEDEEEEEEEAGPADEEDGPIQAKLKKVRLERISDFYRVEGYGGQSWCVSPVETRHDKMMREICVCYYMEDDKPEPESSSE